MRKDREKFKKKNAYDSVVDEIWSMCSITVSKVLAYTHGFLCVKKSFHQDGGNGGKYKFLIKILVKLAVTLPKLCIKRKIM